MPEQPRNAELFVGIVARMGVDTRALSELLAELLHEYNYEVVEIKLTDVLKEWELFADLPQSPLESRYEAYIEAGNKVRRLTQNQAAMARFAIAQIMQARVDDEGGPTPLKRRAFVLNQLKTRQESEFLRAVYGEHYVQISVHADYAHRETVLAKRIAAEHFENPRHENWRTKAGELLDKDNAQEQEPYGQRVRDVFPMSDAVVSAQNPHVLKAQLSRFLHALFGDFRITPTREEYGMQLANTASLRSADLSRQVGAAIMNDQAEVQALGCNEVPKALGGTYWEGDANDEREFQLGADSNDKRKREMLLDIGQKLREAGLLKAEFSDDTLLQKSLVEREDSIINDAQFMDSLEYGRTVHAEMNAITDAARNGHAIRGCVLYCNTFPCHNCAKHIVASGIKRLIYLRPYPKSYASDLFDDSISIDHSPGRADRVEFNQFIGIVGPIYERIFSKVRWKEGDGKVPKFDKSQAAFIRRNPVPAYTHIEEVFRQEWVDVLVKKDLIKTPTTSAEEAVDVSSAHPHPTEKA